MAQVITCPYCGKLTDPKLESCPHCGGGVSLSDAASRGISGQQLIGMPKPPAQKCPNCGAVVKSGDILCVKCGTNLLTGQKLTGETREIIPVAKRDRAPWRMIVGISVLLLGVVAGLFVFTFVFRDKVDRANQAASEGNLLGAVEILTPYLKKHPNDGRALFALGTYQWKLNQSAEAAESFENAAKFDPTNRQAPMMAVLSLGTSSNVKERQIALLQQAVKADPQNAEAFRLLGLLSDGPSQANAQLEALRKAASLAGANSAAQASLGVALALQGDYVNAATELNKAGEEPVAQTAIGFVSAMSGNGVEAQQALEAIVAKPASGTTPTLNGLVLARLGILLTEQGKYEEARKFLNDAMTRVPDNRAAQFYYAICLQAAGSTGDAVREFEAVAQSSTDRDPSPFLKDALLCAADLHATLGNAEKARQALDKAATAGASDSPAFYVIKGRLALINNDAGAARDAYRKAIQLDPQYPATYLEDALLNVKLQMFAEGLADLEKYASLTEATPGGIVPDGVSALKDHLTNILASNGGGGAPAMRAPEGPVKPASKPAATPQGKPGETPGQATPPGSPATTTQAGGKAI